MNTKRQFILGVFFLASLSTLVFYTLFFTDFTLFSEPIEEVVYFPDAGGLRDGDPVRVAGLKVGRVGKVDFDLDAPTNQRIKVMMLLDLPVILRADYSISIKETTMLGGHHIAIEPGRYGGELLRLGEGENLLGQIALNPLAALGSVGDLFDRNSTALDGIMSNLEEVIRKINTGEGPAGRLINDDSMGRDLAEAIAKIRQVANDLAKATADLNAGRGVLGVLLHDEELAGDLKGTVSNISNLAAELNAGRGTFGRFLKDDTLADSFEQAVRSFSAFAQSLEKGEGALGMIVNDPELKEQVSDIVTNLQKTSEDLAALVAGVQAGEGTLGKIIKNDELYQEFFTMVGLLTRSLEDYREAAPISSITGVLFSAF